MTKKLWFNQTGDGLPDIAVADMIDKFDDTPNLRHMHPFGFDDLPVDVQFNEQGEHCEFLKTEREQLLTNLNFAKTQQEIDDIYQALDILSEAGSGEECVY